MLKTISVQPKPYAEGLHANKARVKEENDDILRVYYADETTGYCLQHVCLAPESEL
jgi:hypothetical protein